MNSLASRLQANSPVSVCRVIVTLVGLLQVVTCVIVALHLTGHIQVQGGDQQGPAEVEAEAFVAANQMPPAEAEAFVAANQMPLLRHLKRPRNRTPVAHLPIVPTTTHTQREVRATMVLWNAKQGFLSQFGYHDGRLLVRKPGLYYVYTKTCFRYYTELESGLSPAHTHTHTSPSERHSLDASSSSSAAAAAAAPSPAQLIQYVFHERPSRGAPLRPVMVMKSGSTQHWSEGGYNMYCQQQGRAVALRTGDGLFVRVSNSWMLDPEAEGSYFGAFRIGH